jgi:glycosyltransferase involved in cell wall biosynthesis
MRIVYVCADAGIPLRGTKGASVHVRSITSALARRGNHVVLACRNLEGDNPLPPGVAVEALPHQESQQVPWLTALLTRTRAEVVLERYSLSSTPARTAARGCGIPHVLEVNAPLVDEAARYRGLGNLERWRSWERAVLASADSVIAVSTAVREHVVSAGQDPRQVIVINNGVNVADFAKSDGREIRARYGLGDRTVIGFSGSLKPWHGVDVLLDALTELPRGVMLLIVGDGPERARLEQAAAEPSLAGRVVFTGSVPHAMMPGHLAAMDIATAPYAAQQDFYFSPLKVAEYLAAGLPVVASAQGDVPHIVGDAGVLVPPGDARALSSALARLCAEPAQRRRLADAATVRAGDLDWTRVAARVEGVLQSAGVPA